MSIEANYKSFCGSCGKAIEVGQLIDKVASRWVHTACKARQSKPPEKPPSVRRDHPKSQGQLSREGAVRERPTSVVSKTPAFDPDFFGDHDDLDDLDMNAIDFDKIMKELEMACPLPEQSSEPTDSPSRNSELRSDPEMDTPHKPATTRMKYENHTNPKPIHNPPHWTDRL